MRTPCVRSETSENRKNTEFATIFGNGPTRGLPRACACRSQTRGPRGHPHGASCRSRAEAEVGLQANGVVAWHPRSGLVGYSAPVLPYPVPPKFMYYSAFQNYRIGTALRCTGRSRGRGVKNTGSTIAIRTFFCHASKPRSFRLSESQVGRQR
jgi:hypothetical protein